jgi:hypothetical protein
LIARTIASPSAYPVRMIRVVLGWRSQTCARELDPVISGMR